MDENLIGHLLSALDDDADRHVREHLRTDPEAARRLETLRRAVEPLAADRPDPEPPRDLWVRTLARVGERRRPGLPQAPSVPFSRAAPRRSWWRRADVLAAASILLVVCSLLPSGVLYLHRERDKAQCRNNLSLFHQALTTYADLHQGELPKVDPQPPFNFAGVFAPILHEEGLLGDRAGQLNCPSTGRGPGRLPSRKELEDLRRDRPGEFVRLASQASGSYAYALGYREPDGRVVGLRRGPDTDGLPILADRPPFTHGGVCPLTDNSTNHGGGGQNVLYLGGNVQFFTHRNVGVDRDDIFLNRDGRVEAGAHRWDTVLGASTARPVQEP